MIRTIEIRPVDAHGDAIDCYGFRDIAEARKHIPKISGEVVAWVMERRTEYGCCSSRPDRFDILSWSGDAKALQAGGWAVGGAS